jgi:hypothetical protein
MYGQPWSMYVPQTYPSLGGVQLAPQGFFGNLLGQLAGPAGQAFGGLFGQPQIGGQIGQMLGGLGHLLPFQVAPGISPAVWGGQPMYGGWGGQPMYGGWGGQPMYGGGQPGYAGGQLAPQGFWGNLLGQFPGPAGQAFGGLFGQPQIGGQIGQALGGLGHLLPFQVVPIPVPVGLPGGVMPPYLGSPLPFQAVPA